MTPKITLIDVETAPLLTATFSLYPERIGHESIIKDWFLICGAWKELGKSSIKSVSLLDDAKRFNKDVNDDYYVTKKLAEVCRTSEILVGHNSVSFDMKKINARLIYHGFEPIPKIHHVDTLKEVKKIAAFTSNRLDYLGKHLTNAGKMETGKGLWLRVLTGDKKAIKEMVRYNKADVILLEKVYNKLLPYMNSHPHVGAMSGLDKNHSCPKCGSSKMTTKLHRYTAAGIRKVQKQCNECHSYSTFGDK